MSTAVASRDDLSGRLMLAVADRYQARFARTFLASMRAVRHRITDEVAADALSEPIGVGRLWNLLDQAPIVKDATSDAIDAYAEVASNAAHATLSTWVTGLTTGGRKQVFADLAARLDVKSPFMQRAAETLTANLVTQVDGATKDAIRQVILTAMRDGVGPHETAGVLQNVVGLTGKQAQAVLNFRRGLADARDKVPGRRPLDSWTLAKLPQRLTFTPAQIDSLTDKYADRLLSHRAYNIARTETLYAANAGQQLTFKELARGGFIDPTTFRRVWSVVDDDRLCEECAPMNGQTVALEGNFESTEVGLLPSERTPRDEPVIAEFPPLHPSCRCIIVTEQG